MKNDDDNNNNNNNKNINNNNNADDKVMLNDHSMLNLSLTPLSGGQCTEGIPANTLVCCVGLAKSVFQQLEKKSGEDKTQEIAAIVGVSMK